MQQLSESTTTKHFHTRNMKNKMKHSYLSYVCIRSHFFSLHIDERSLPCADKITTNRSDMRWWVTRIKLTGGFSLATMEKETRQMKNAPKQR